jgi:hypothetical protein
MDDRGQIHKYKGLMGTVMKLVALTRIEGGSSQAAPGEWTPEGANLIWP